MVGISMEMRLFTSMTNWNASASPGGPPALVKEVSSILVVWSLSM